MRRKLVSIFLLLIAFIIALQLIAGHKSSAFAAYADEVKKLEVRGDSTINIVPDVAVINLGIQKKSKNLVNAQTEAALILNKIIQMLINEEINENDIQTSNYSVYPEYSYEKNLSTFIGYNVSYSLSVKIHDIKKIGLILQKATEGGCNTTGGIFYEISDGKTYYQKALKLAVSDAQSKAKILAESLGIEDYALFSITEKQAGYVGIKRAAYSDFTTSEIDIMPGTIEFSACVDIVFSF